MRKGFTLIELLTVIVILAILLVIAIPIVLNIINESKESTKKTSSENYLNAVTTAILKENIMGENYIPEKCIVNESGNLICDNDKEIIIKVDGERPESGYILFQEKEISSSVLVFSEVGVVTNENGEVSFDYENYKKVATVGDRKYSLDQFDLALKKSTNENPVKLITDINIEKYVILDEDKNMYLDLNKKTITIEYTGAIMLKGNNSSLTVQNGNIETVGNSVALMVGSNKEDVSQVIKRHLIVESTVKIKANTYGVVGYGKATIDFKGKINLKSSGYGLSGNGDINNENTIFNIYDTAEIIAENGIPVYLPQLGTTTIYGGYLKGKTSIGIKSGNLIIKGGTFEAVGEKKDPVPRESGINATGDVILIEENELYDGNININIEGGNFISKNGYIIQENNLTGRTTIVTGIYSNKKIISGTNRYYYEK